MPSSPPKPSKSKNRPSGERENALRFCLSQAEIENELRKHGSGFQDGKQRIIELYQTQPDRKLRAKALAKEYGIGGHSQDFLDGSSGFVNHDGKGLEFDHYPDHQKVTLSWTQVEKYIDLMIQSDRYLSDKEKRTIDFPLELNAASGCRIHGIKGTAPGHSGWIEAGGNFMFYGEDAAKVAKSSTVPCSREKPHWAKFRSQAFPLAYGQESQKNYGLLAMMFTLPG